MNKKKVYLDTSVISHLKDETAPHLMAETLLLWDILSNSNDYIVYISEIVMEELLKCSESKVNYIVDMLEKIDYVLLESTEEVLQLQEIYFKNNILKEKDKSDLLHISYAVVNNIDCIVSWNFKHFVNLKTTKLVNSTNIMLNYITVNIITPQMITGGVEDERI